MTRAMASRFVPLALLSALAAPGFAQESDSPIVVTGKPELTEERAREVVGRVARPVDGQLARFHDPVCPRVIGFDRPYEDRVAEWIKATAEEIGAKAGGENCPANLYVVIVDDGAGFVEQLHREHPETFAGLAPSEVEELAQPGSAARAWTVTWLTNSAGQVAAQPSPSGGGGTVKTGFAGSSVRFDGGANVLRVYESSTINPSVQQTAGAAWVVIETRATLGKSLRQIADYAAMRGLAMVRPEQLDGSVETILELFEADAAASPPRLTEFDRAFLASLYRVPSRRWARSQVRYIADAVAREAEQGKP